MGFMDKVGAKLATKYGTVYKGRYNGCQVALGNPPNKKVEFANSFSQIIFVEGTEEKGRYDILTDLLGISLLSYDDRAFQMLIAFGEDDYCCFNLEIRQEDKPVAGLLKGFLGQKNTISASSPQEKLELQYRGVKVFVQNTALVLLKDNLETFRSYFQERDILDDLTMKILNLALERVQKLEAQAE